MKKSNTFFQFANYTNFTLSICSDNGEGEEEKKSIQAYNVYENKRVKFPVKVKKLEKGNFIIKFKSNGIIKASREVDIYSQLNAKM